MTSNIIIYSKDYCPYCKRAKALLTSKGVQFTEYDVSLEPKRLKEMLQKSSGARTVPQIFIGDYHVGGSDDLAALDRAGKLDPLLRSDSPAWPTHTKTNIERKQHVTS